jgi:hypothetical protein
MNNVYHAPGRPDAAEHELERPCVIVGTQLKWETRSGSGQKAHIRPEGSTNEETSSGGTQRNGNPQATGDCRQGGSDTQKKENLTAATTTQADLSRYALELKLSRPAPAHPGSGPAVFKERKFKESQKPLRVGASKGEVGRVSQEERVAQARKDSGDR